MPRSNHADRGELLYIGQSRIDGDGLFSRKSFSRDEVVSELYGTILLAPNHRSIQIGRNKHFYNRYVDYINHSCMPTSYIRVLGDRVQLVALKPIEKDSGEITINYNYSEYSLARPFKCKCCREASVISGYKYLVADADEDYVKLLQEYAVPYLRDLAREEPASGSIGKRAIEAA
jgi:SET domain